MTRHAVPRNDESFSMLRTLLAIAVLSISLTASGPTRAADANIKTYSKAASFEDVSESVKDAILKRGYVIDYVGQLNAMLQRTAKDTGTVSQAGSTSPYKNAIFVQFCPAKLTHEAVSASPLAIANCPIAIFIYELAYEQGKVTVGFRMPVASPSKRVTEINEKIVSLLQDIAQDATR